MRKTEIIKVVAFGLTFGIIFLMLSIILKPKWIDLDQKFEPATCIEDGFYAEPKNEIDALFLGSSNAYEDINPLVLWKQKKITSYVLGSGSQKVWTSYYYLQEALKYQKPKVVLLELYGLKMNYINNDAMNRKVFDYMKLSKEKLDSIDSSIDINAESKMSYIFTIMRYHDRWQDLTQKDFTYPLGNKNFIYKGHWIHFNTVKTDTMNFYAKTDEYNIDPKVMKYLDKIVDLCKQENIELMFFKSPRSDWYEADYLTAKRYAEKQNIPYIDYNLFYKDLGITDEKHFRDNGGHLNDEGANILTKNIGQYLSENYNIISQKNDIINKHWDDDYNSYLVQKKEYIENN